MTPKVLEHFLAEFQAKKPTSHEHLETREGILTLAKPGLGKEGEINLSPQLPSGQSIWAEWLRKGDIEEWMVCWAWRKSGGGREWLAVRLDTGHGKPMFINLHLTGSFSINHPSGRKGLRTMEKEFSSFLAKKNRARIFEKEIRDIISDPSIDARCEIEKRGWTLKVWENSERALIEADMLYDHKPDEISLSFKDKVVAAYYL